MHSITIPASVWLQLRQLTPPDDILRMFMLVPRIVHNVTRRIFHPIFFRLGMKLLETRQEWDRYRYLLCWVCTQKKNWCAVWV